MNGDRESAGTGGGVPRKLATATLSGSPPAQRWMNSSRMNAVSRHRAVLARVELDELDRRPQLGVRLDDASRP